MIDAYSIYDDSYSVAAVRFIESSYGEATRYYHNMKHVRECLGHMQHLLGVRKNSKSIIAEALIWHDVYYDPHKHGGFNEMKSAQLFALYRGREWTLKDAIEICRLIELTASHVVAPDDATGQIVISLDLLILGSPPSRYREYTTGVRKEYVNNGVCSDEAFSTGRAKFLADLLTREHIFPWMPARKMYEAQAQSNVRSELKSLG
jgi:predicted metal-dependent HD superfamily phosphohydrolase